MFEIKRENIGIDYNELKDSEFYYNFSNGVEIDDEQISEWINNAIEHLLNADFGSHYSTGSGNTVVHASKYQYGDNPEDGGYIEINICRGYEEIEIPLETLIKK